GEEWMALGADFQLDIANRRASDEACAAHAGDACRDIFRMNAFFHCCLAHKEYLVRTERLTDHRNAAARRPIGPLSMRCMLRQLLRRSGQALTAFSTSARSFTLMKRSLYL